MTTRSPSRRSPLRAGLLLGVTLAAACTDLPPVEVGPAPAGLAGLRILVPAEVVLTGERLNVVLRSNPELARTSLRELGDALEKAGYLAVSDASKPHDVRIQLTMNVAAASSSVTTGRWASFVGQMGISNGAGRLGIVYAQSHPDDVGRYYPSVEEAAARVVRGLVNQIGTLENLVEMTGAGKGTAPQGDKAPAAGNGLEETGPPPDMTP